MITLPGSNMKSSGITKTKCTQRRGFTLIELLVVITIVLVLSVVVLASFNYSINGDRVRSAARQFQSFVAGARDKAIFANEIRGVRLLLDPNDNHAVAGMQYIGSPQTESGTLTFNPSPNAVSVNPNFPGPFDTTGRTVFFSFGDTRWSSLKRRGLLRVGARIQIPAKTGQWYTVSAINLSNSSATGEPVLTLNAPNTDLASSSGAIPYILELGSTILGDAQPVLFPRGVVIDLDGSQLPFGWRAASLNYPTNPPASSYSPRMDILFTPRGTVVGDLVGTGMLHLHFADTFDVAKWHTSTNANWSRTTTTYAATALPQIPADSAGTTTPIVTRDRVLATLSPRTGNVGIHYVNTANASNSLAVDPFKFAETGQVANK